MTLMTTTTVPDTLLAYAWRRRPNKVRDNMKRMTSNLTEVAAPRAASPAVPCRHLAASNVWSGPVVKMIRQLGLLLSVSIGLLIALPIDAATAEDADAKGEHVLFVGNSFTKGNNLPELVRLIADANGAAINTDGALRNGARLDALAWYHKDKLQSRQWDAVIMQGHSIGQLFEIHRTISGAEKIAELCHEARLYVFATWAYASEERFVQKVQSLKEEAKGSTIIPDEYKDMYNNMQLLLNIAAAQVANAAKTVKINNRNKQVNITVVPVGSVWQAALKKHPDWRLHSGDDYHQNRAGSYLSALVFYKVLLGHLPEKAAKQWVDQGWIDQATHDKMIAVIENMPRGTFAADDKDDQSR